MPGAHRARPSGPVVLDVPAHEELLGARYRLQSEIAVGGMGWVWRAHDTRLERPVAVKVLRSELSDDATFRTRFRTEARHAAALNHPNIAAVHDYGESADPVTGEQVAYLVMELVDGEPLSSLLQRTPVPGLDRTLGIVRQTASALAAAHALGVVHRDVKPANVLVTPDGTVKLTDFGIAWSASNAPLTSTGHVMGTPHYLAPEQVQGNRATTASDVYSLGVIAYECLAGRRPFEGGTAVDTALMHIRENPPPLPDSVPDDVRALVQQAMAREAADRPADGAALRDAVDALLPPHATVAPAQPVADQDRTLALTLAASRPAGATAVLPVADAQLPAGPAPVAPAAQQPDDGRAAGHRRRLVAALVIAAVVALVVLVLGVVAFSRSPVRDAAASAPVATRPARPTPAATPSAAVTSAATSSTPATVRVAAKDLVGRPIAAVQAQLAGAGLQVVPQATQTREVPAGQVVAVSAIGELPPGSTVTVVYAVEPPAPTTTAASSGSGPSGSPSGGRSNGHRSGRGHHGDD
jgi:serine/threonine-protein kinase